MSMTVKHAVRGKRCTHCNLAIDFKTNGGCTYEIDSGGNRAKTIWTLCYPCMGEMGAIQQDLASKMHQLSTQFVDGVVSRLAAPINADVLPLTPKPANET